MKTNFSLSRWALFGTLALAALSTTGCDPIRGTLQVTRAFNALVGTQQSCSGEDYPCSSNQQTVSIAPGTYQMSVDRKGRDSVVISLKGSGSEKDLELNIPSGKQLPANGTLQLSSQESGQPFDLSATSQTSVQDSAPRRGVESCQVERMVQVCNIVGGGPNNPPHEQCMYQPQYVPGQQEVEFYLRDTTQNMTAEITSQNNKAGTFAGTKVSSQKIYTFQGPCF